MDLLAARLIDRGGGDDLACVYDMARTGGDPARCHAALDGILIAVTFRG